MSGPVHLLDGNVLVALIDETHVHHAAAVRWFSGFAGAFSTCAIAQSTLLTLAMRLGGQGIKQAVGLLAAVTAHQRHQFWPDTLPYDQVRWRGVIAHRQVTDAYLVNLARHHAGLLVTFDKGLVALHADVGVAVELPP